MSALATSIEDLVTNIGDGARIALPPDYSGCAMSAVATLIRKGVKDLHIVGVPTAGLQSDWLVGSGCVKRLEVAAMTLGEFGVPPRCAAAFKAGTVEMREATCPAIQAGLQAAEKGIPFMPLRGILGSDLLVHRNDWTVIDNPLSEDKDPIVLIPAIKPDVTLFHAPKADRDGNVWIGVRRELMLMAHASRQTLVTVEAIEDADFLRDDAYAAGTIPALYIDAIAEAPRGGAPVGLAGHYADRQPGHQRLCRSCADRGRFQRMGGPPYSRPRACLMGDPSQISAREAMIAAIAPMLADLRHVAVGASSPIPASAALLARKLSGGRLRVSLLGSVENNPFTDGGKELFDCAAQGRIDAFFLSGGQIDGQANINLMGIGTYPNLKARFPGTFGSAYLYHLIPRVILFREEHTPRTLVEKVDFVSAAGSSDEGTYRPGGPYALVTSRCSFRFDKDTARFRLNTLHPGVTREDVKAVTGFSFDTGPDVPTTPQFDLQTAQLLKTEIAEQVAEIYPVFADQLRA